ncbi:MAG TPA: DUF5329 family protein [Candidatus Didemnitutus sp.]|nr:DUF5329 family protein [Candidatus Didemnitutus sp.]
MTLSLTRIVPLLDLARPGKAGWLLVLLVFGWVPLQAAPRDEIEALAHFLGHLDGADFVRNGSTHTAAEAEAHLRLKWKNQSDQIVTAEDFIRLCGTGSSMTGQPYLIRFKDGHEEPCAVVLQRELKAIRNKAAAEPNRATLPSPAPH